MTKFLSFLCLLSATGFLAIGCSTVSFTSDDTIPVVFEKRENHTRDISIKVTEEFYLWGLFPTTRKVLLDKEFVRQGHESVAEVIIEEDNDKRDLAWTVFTLGFYLPKSYVIKGKTREPTF